MTRNECLRMAREAGIVSVGGGMNVDTALERYAASCYAAGIEEAAQVCHRYAMGQRIHSLACRGGLDCEVAIRALAQPSGERTA